MPLDPGENPPDGLPPDLEGAAKEVHALLDSDPTEAWPALRRRLASLLMEGEEAKDFSKRLAFVEAGLRLTLKSGEDDSLFVLVQMLSDRQYGYSATHALLAASTCLLVAPMADIAEPQLSSLVRAALTMNIAMTEMQDVLATQAHQTTPYQREAIESHPTLGVDILKALGVNDTLWLELVQDHHESDDGQGYPNQKVQLSIHQQILRMSDLFIAQISPRTSRRGIWPNVVVAKLYNESQRRSSPLGTYFAKQLGMYPPGSYVKLHSGETAVVISRGVRVNAPVTMAIMDPANLALSKPIKRNSEVPKFAIKSPVSPEDIRIRLDRSRLLKRV
jgi:HD-GYP domain-containing protein (c-di-GMP phosphodiesterase class II)